MNTKHFLLALVAITLMVPTWISCTKDLVPEVVTDDKPFTYDEYMDLIHE